MAQGHKSMTVTRRLRVRSPLEGMNYYLLICSLFTQYLRRHRLNKV